MFLSSQEWNNLKKSEIPFLQNQTCAFFMLFFNIDYYKSAWWEENT